MLLKLDLLRTLMEENPCQDMKHFTSSGVGPAPPAKQGHGQTALSPDLQVHQPRLRLACSDRGPEESGST